MFNSNASTVSGGVTYIEDVFASYLYTGTDAARSIVNNIDLSTKGGLVWTKDRTVSRNHFLVDTVRGVNNNLSTDSTGAQSTSSTVTAFNTDGFSLSNQSTVNSAPDNYVSWTFREQAKFFDVVTYTGTGVAKTVAHNLGSTPGCVIVKRTDGGAGYGWPTYHRGVNSGTNPQNYALYLSSANAQATSSSFWNNTAPTSTEFTVGTDADTNTNGGTYIAYLFAHDAGGFGLTGTDNVVSCGAFSTDSGGKATVNLGYEPQWVMFKRTDSATFGNWYMVDNMRGFTNPSGSSWLWANTTGAEQTGISLSPQATGFSINFTGPANWVYVAVRRGPMKVPTDGTKVFKPNTVSSDASAQTTNFPVDMFLTNKRAGDALNTIAVSKLTSNSGLVTSSTAAEAANYASATWWQSNTSYTAGVWGTASIVDYAFQRAPSFFDEVCYTGTGATQNVTHNLGVAPELIIVKSRTQAVDWVAYAAPLGNTGAVFPNRTDANVPLSVWWNSTSPTSTQFTVGASAVALNNSGSNYVAYLFATCAGVSKVGSYTGTGTTKQVDCGFAAGARFVLIKRTDSTGDWYVWDTARGIVSGNDPYLLLNSTAAEVTTTDYIDPYSAGFELSSTAPAALNASGGTYIFLAIA